MSFERYLLGVALTAVVLASVALAGACWRHRLLPGWSGAPARLAEATIAAGLLVAVPTLLGVIGALQAVPVVAGYVLAGGASLLAARELPGPGPSGGTRAPHPSPGTVWVAIAAAALVLAEWAVQALGAFEHGMNASDTLSYHGPIAARFVQDASVTGLHQVYADPVIVFFPFNSELLHSVAFLLFGTDFLSPLLNFGWLGLALLAGWCIGRPAGVAPATLVATALILGTPALVGSQPGGAGNDVPCVALLLTVAALLLNGWPRPAAVGLAALAAGLAIGTKVTMIAPVGVLLVGLIVIAGRGRRVRTALQWALILPAAGGVWYLRNLVDTGSPMPTLDLGVLPAVSQPETFAVVHYLGDSKVWSDWYLPGLDEAFGPLWWVIAGLALAGAAGIAARGRSALERMLGLVVLASVVAYLFTPRSADGPEGVPYFFSFTLRYISPSLALGLALLVLIPGVRAWARRAWVLLAPLALLVVTLWDFGGIATGDRRRLALAVLFTAALALAARRAALPRPRPALAGAVALGACVAIAAGGWVVARDYVQDRYDGDDLAVLRDLRDARVATVGWVRSYPLYGSDFSNAVAYVARHGDGGEVSEIGSCREWLEALARGRYDYVVTSPPVFPYGLPGFEEARQSSWTRADPAATQLVKGADNLVVFRLEGSPTPASCP